MAKGKVKSSSNKAFAKGGGGGMAGKMSVGTQKPGQTAQAGRGGGKFAKGGGGGMAGKGSVGTQKPARTSQN